MLDNTKLIFTSTTGRSGTKYLANIVNNNALNATAEHDPYPRGYGEPIKWYDEGKTNKLKKLAIKKCKRLERGIKGEILLDFPFLKNAIGRNQAQSKIYAPPNKILRNYMPSVRIKDIYLESTHAFIKSFGEEMVRIVDNVEIIHLTRTPLEVAKSFFNRCSIPGPDNPYLLFPGLKKNELKISMKMNDFQKCLWYWFECELRHVKFLEEHNIENVYDVDINDLNDIEKVEKLFQSIGIEHTDIELAVGRNKNKKKSSISKENIRNTKTLLEKIPDEVFDRIGDRYRLRENIRDKK